MPKKYAEGKRDPSSIVYPHPSLKNVLHKTYGQLIYQEQLIKMAQILAGMTFVEADLLRKACAKKKKKLLDEIEPKFRQGCAKNKIQDSVINEMWQLCVEFGQYAFNEAHSTGYGFICYQTAYLKTYYTTEFICSLLTSEANKNDEALERMVGALKKEYPELEILKPDINKSKKMYYPVGDLKVISPFVSIKGVGKKVSDTIVDVRNEIGFFSSMDHFMRMINSGGKTMMSGSVAELLIDNNVFEIFGSKEDVTKEMKRFQSIKKIVAPNKSGDTDPTIKAKMKLLF
jgi:DNA polymerase-3 subunit alpha